MHVHIQYKQYKQYKHCIHIKKSRNVNDVPGILTYLLEFAPIDLSYIHLRYYINYTVDYVYHTSYIHLQYYGVDTVGPLSIQVNKLKKNVFEVGIVLDTWKQLFEKYFLYNIFGSDMFKKPNRWNA